MEFLKVIFLKLTAAVKELSLTVYSDLSSEVEGLFLICLTLYIALYGYKFILKKISDRAFIEVLTSLFVVGVAYSIATDVEKYQSWILNPLLGTSLNLSNFLLKSVAKMGGVSDVDTFSFLDNAYPNLAHYSEAMKPTGNALTNLGLYIEVYSAKFLLYGFFFFFALTFFIYFLVCWSIIYLLSMFASLFLLMACFKKTKGFAENWLKTLITAAFSIVLLHAVLGLTIGGLDQSFGELATVDLSQGAFNGFFLMALFWCVVSSLLMLMVPQLTQSLTNASFSIGGAAVAGAIGGATIAKAKTMGAKGASYGIDTLKGGGAIKHGKQAYGGATELLKRIRGMKE